MARLRFQERVDQFNPINIRVQIDPRSLTELEGKAKGYAGRLSLRIKRIVQQTANDIRDYAISIAPEDTGFLKSEIIATETERVVTEWVSLVLSGAEYSAYVEFGTYTNRAQPFMRPALKKYAPIFRKRIEDAIRQTK